MFMWQRPELVSYDNAGDTYIKEESEAQKTNSAVRNRTQLYTHTNFSGRLSQYHSPTLARAVPYRGRDDVSCTRVCTGEEKKGRLEKLLRGSRQTLKNTIIIIITVSLSCPRVSH